MPQSRVWMHICLLRFPPIIYISWFFNYRTRCICWESWWESTCGILKLLQLMRTGKVCGCSYNIFYFFNFLKTAPFTFPNKDSGMSMLGWWIMLENCCLVYAAGISDVGIVLIIITGLVFLVVFILVYRRKNFH